MGRRAGAFSTAGLVRVLAALILALVVPFYALTAVLLDVRGPAHVHVGHSHEHGHSRAHGGIAHHHHHHDDHSVVIVHRDGVPEEPAAAETGRSGTMVAALLSRDGWPELPALHESRVPGHAIFSRSLVLECPERPPRRPV